MNTPELTLPHPRMHMRDFVFMPIALLDSKWRHPVLGASPLRLTKDCGEWYKTDLGFIYKEHTIKI